MYRPVIAGNPASSAYAMPWGTSKAVSTRPATMSLAATHAHTSRACAHRARPTPSCVPPLLRHRPGPSPLVRSRSLGSLGRRPHVRPSGPVRLGAGGSSERFPRSLEPTELGDVPGNSSAIAQSTAMRTRRPIVGMADQVVGPMEEPPGEPLDLDAEDVRRPPCSGPANTPRRRSSRRTAPARRQGSMPSRWAPGARPVASRAGPSEAPRPPVVTVGHRRDVTCRPCIGRPRSRAGDRPPRSDRGRPAGGR